MSLRRKAVRRGEYTQVSVTDIPLPDLDASPADYVERKEMLERLTRAMGQLGDRCRELMRLKLQGRTFPEIQKIMGAGAINTIYTWDHRCRKNLLELMGGDWEQDSDEPGRYPQTVGRICHRHADAGRAAGPVRGRAGRSGALRRLAREQLLRDGIGYTDPCAPKPSCWRRWTSRPAPWHTGACVAGVSERAATAAMVRMAAVVRARGPGGTDLAAETRPSAVEVASRRR